ncbi:MAG: hypothetical protein RIM99_04905 [Cyclobacteriaceae bacterium]
MNPLDQFESEQKMLNELKDLFKFVRPAVIRRNLEDLYFLYMSSAEDPDLPDQKNFTTNFYYLINFLNEMEGLFNEDAGNG